MDPISVAMGLVKYVPSLIGWFTGDDGDAKKAEDIIAIAKDFMTVEGDTDFETAFKQDPKAAVAFKTAVMSHQIDMAKENTKRIESVNKTMQVETKSEHWMQWSWRPFNGYLFGITLFLNYVVPSIANIILAFFHITDTVPDGMMFSEVVRVVPVGVIPEFVLIAWGAVLGVTSWTRGKEKLENKAGKLL